MLLKQAVEEFILDRRVHCRQRTSEWYAYMLEPLRAHFPFSLLSEITARDLNELLIGVRATRRLSDISFGGHIRALRIFFRYWMARGVLETDPTIHIKPPRVPLSPKTLTVGQLDKLLRTLEQGGWLGIKRDRAVVYFLLETGCRAQEALGLKLSDVNFDERWCDVLGKGNKKRRLALHPRTIRALRKYLGDRTEGPVFLALPQNGQRNLPLPMSYNNLRQMMRRLARRAALPLHANMLRHTFATFAVEAGMDVSHVQVVLGHTRVDTTEIYIAAARANAAMRAHRQHSPIQMIERARRVK